MCGSTIHTASLASDGPGKGQSNRAFDRLGPASRSRPVNASVSTTRRSSTRDQGLDMAPSVCDRSRLPAHQMLPGAAWAAARSLGSRAASASYGDDELHSYLSRRADPAASGYPSPAGGRAGRGGRSVLAGYRVWRDPEEDVGKAWQAGRACVLTAGFSRRSAAASWPQ